MMDGFTCPFTPRNGGVKGGIIPPFNCRLFMASALRRRWARELALLLRVSLSRSNCKKKGSPSWVA